jgi:predicted nucleic acid-binding protein
VLTTTRQPSDAARSAAGSSSAAPVDRRFADLGLGLVDGSVVALAESLGVHRLATRDVRHFAAVRLRDGRSFDLVVHPMDPDSAS